MGGKKKQGKNANTAAATNAQPESAHSQHEEQAQEESTITANMTMSSSGMYSTS